MSPNLPDGLKQQITLPLVAHEADISGTKWNVWTTAGGITTSRLLLLWFLISPYGSLAIKPAHIIVFIALFSECAKVLPPQACRLPLN